jgi:hypothetical protein
MEQGSDEVMGAATGMPIYQSTSVLKTIKAGESPP